MVPGILGKKVGMTQIFHKDGHRIPVTVLEVGPCQILSLKSKESNGYDSVQLGYEETKESRLNKPQREEYKAKKVQPKKFVKEIRCEDVSDLKVGDQVTTTIFQEGDYLDVTGTSKGKGFQGGMKRHGWSGGKATHGSMCHRVPGSIGCSASPSRVWKGHNMPGHMGAEQVTVQNLQVVDVNADNNTIAVEGAVPGANGGYVVVKYARKKPLAERKVADADTAEVEDESKEGSKE